MRATAYVLAALLASSPAAAQSWTEYVYPGFKVSFPAEPTVATMPYVAPDGRTVEAQLYSVSENGGVFKMMVADLGDPNLEEGPVIDGAIKALAQGGEVKVDIAARINRIFGRQFSITGADGSHSTAAVFYYNGKLYEIEGTARPGGEAGAADTIRFQQSLIFTDGGSNRSQDAFRAQRQACRDAAAAAASGDAGRADDPRCRRRGGDRRGPIPN